MPFGICGGVKDIFRCSLMLKFKEPNIVCSLVPSSPVDGICQFSFGVSGVWDSKLPCHVSYRFCVFLPFLFPPVLFPAFI